MLELPSKKVGEGRLRNKKGGKEMGTKGRKNIKKPKQKKDKKEKKK